MPHQEKVGPDQPDTGTVYRKSQSCNGLTREKETSTGEKGQAKGEKGQPKGEKGWREKSIWRTEKIRKGTEEEEVGGKRGRG